jgi:hypothetical protein
VDWDNALTSRQFCRAVGVTYRVADYWVRTEVLRPSVFDARGSGSQRLYSERDVEIGRVLASMASHSAEVPVLRSVAASLARLDGTWSGWLVVTGDGEVSTTEDPVMVFDAEGLTAAWVVRLEGAVEPSLDEAWAPATSV